MSVTNKKYLNGVSVVIVTYNGSNRLLPTLSHLAQQKNIDFDIEIILVDNNSNDGTSKKAQQLWDELKSPFTLRIVNEKQSGTMFARKRGVNESKYRYMLYCDDDNWLSEDYVSTAYSTIVKDSQIAAVGGKGFMEYEVGFEVPNWMKEYEHNFGTGAQGEKDGDTTNVKGCLYTAGTIIDLQWLDKLYALGFESTLQGRDGKTLVAGEDTELMYALRLVGGKLYYNSKMTFKHYMPAARINWEYLKKLWFGFGMADFVLYPYANYFKKRKNPTVLRLLLATFKQLLILRMKKNMNKSVEGDRNELLYIKKKGFLMSILKNKQLYKKAIINTTTLKSA